MVAKGRSHMGRTCPMDDLRVRRVSNRFSPRSTAHFYFDENPLRCYLASIGEVQFAIALCSFSRARENGRKRLEALSLVGFRLTTPALQY